MKCDFCGEEINGDTGFFRIGSQVYCNLTCSEKASEEFDETYRGEYFEKVILPKICEVHKKEIMKEWKKLDDPGILLTPTDQKHEKIEKMAWEFCNTNYENIRQMHADNQRTCSAVAYCIEIGWQMAEQFYDYAKQKQEEANDV